MRHLPYYRTQSLVAKTGSDRRAVQSFSTDRTASTLRRIRRAWSLVYCVRRHAPKAAVVIRGNHSSAQPACSALSQSRGVWPQVCYSACGSTAPSQARVGAAARGACGAKLRDAWNEIVMDL